MKANAIKKQIDLLRDTCNHHWNVTAITTAATLTLLFHMNLLLSKIMFIVGLLFAAIFFSAYFAKEDEIKKLINELAQEEK